MAYSKKEIDTIFNKICKKIANGKSLRSILLDEDMPSSRTFFKWIDQDDSKVKQYAQACSDRADKKFDSIEEDYLETPQRDPETGKIDTGWVQLQRLKIDAKKWELSKLMPKKYGNSIDVTSEGKSIATPTIIVQSVDE